MLPEMTLAFGGQGSGNLQPSTSVLLQAINIACHLIIHVLLSKSANLIYQYSDQLEAINNIVRQLWCDIH